MLDSITATRIVGTPPNPDFWNVSATAGNNSVSLKLINVSNAAQFAQAVAKMLTVLDAVANAPSGNWVVDVTKI